jgi:hypothetical protein
MEASGSKDIAQSELRYWKTLLIPKLEKARAEQLFTPKATAKVIFGRFEGFGFVDKRLAGSDAFVMPGPHEQTGRAGPALRDLGD